MAQLLFLVVSLIGCLAPSIRATSHLQFANGTRQVNVTRAGCGNAKLCLEDPEGCDPAAGSCLFGSVTAGLVEASNGSSLSITLRLSGESNQYVALGLTADQPEGTTTVFVCGQANGSFQFFAAKRNNSARDGVLTLSETPVEGIQGQLTGRMVQCSFTVPNVNATATGGSHVTTFIVELGTGVINGNKPGPFSLVRMEGPLDLANLTNNKTVTTDNSTTPVNNTTTPVNNTTTPVKNSTTTPADNSTTPADSNTTPADNNATTPAPMIYTKTPVTNATMPTSMRSIQNISGSFSSSASLLLWSFLTCFCFALRRM
ncbi:unnamed protein product [Arctogadus glacialis]